MTLGISLAEKGLLPDPVVRFGIRRLLAKRLVEEAEKVDSGQSAGWLDGLERAPIAYVPDAANDQHYEVPSEFYEAVLGKHLKYSSAYWPEGVERLDDAEAAMLELAASRAGLEDGQLVLDLGCGWGSFALWIAQRFPSSRVVGVSNSRGQRRHIMSRARRAGLENVEVVTADMNEFDTTHRFDRIVSVEMFEHMRNWPALLKKVRRWVQDDGRLFIHVFSHKSFAYEFGDSGDDDWMGKNFFTGGMMPSVDLLDRLEIPFSVERRWEISGTHYAKTAEAWLANLDANRESVRSIFEKHMSSTEAQVQTERWRLFFLSCAELFGFRGGSEWLVTHHLLEPKHEVLR